MMNLCGCSVVLALVLVWVPGPRPGPDGPGVHFRNVAQASGVRFVHHYSATPGRYFVESAPGGLAVFDYNGDGRPDIFFTNGADTPSLEKSAAADANRLYRNDGQFRFTDVTDSAGVRGIGYAMGAAAADYDNDGHIDLFVAGVRQNQLLRNLGDGRFEDVTARSGIASGDWAVAAGWFDYDNDGLLDLMVVNYVKWSADTNRSCGDPDRGIAIYCHPRAFQGLPDHLYRNRGDGTFEDVSARAGLLDHIGKGMSVAFADYDHDGRLDMFVPNDTVPNFLFHNKGDGTFEETALLAGSRCPTPDARSRAWAPTFRTTTTMGGRTCTSRRLPAKRFRSSRTTATGRSSRRRKRAGSRPPRSRPQAGARSSPTPTTTGGRTSSPPTRM